MNVGTTKQALDNLRQATKKIRPMRTVILIGSGCLVVLLLLVGLLTYHQTHLTNRTSQSAKAPNSNMTVTGTINPALAACDIHAKRLQVMVAGKKLYVLEASGQLLLQLRSPRTIGHLVQVKGTIDGTQPVCSYGKSKDTPVLKVSKVQQF